MRRAGWPVSPLLGLLLVSAAAAEDRPRPQPIRPVPPARPSFAPMPMPDGSIPIGEPTVIEKPGRYALVRSIEAVEDDATIRIESDRVHLDLNGFSIEAHEYLNGSAIFARGDQITIENGKIVGGFIFSDDGVVDVAGRNATIRNLDIRTEDHAFDAIRFQGSTGLIADNQVRGGQLHVDRSNDLTIRDNRIFGHDQGADIDCRGCLVVDNLITAADDDGLYVHGNGTTVARNIIEFAAYDGITVNGNGMIVEGNTIGSLYDGNGLVVYADRSMIRDNVVIDSTVIGLLLRGDDNVYRGNFARGTPNPNARGFGFENCDASNRNFCDLGENNTSHGDNYMPDRM